jgi:diguanylate cyclase (GGDEF)-like protein/PAS domain S-box-containing protein
MGYRKNPVSADELRRLAQERLSGHLSNAASALNLQEAQRLFEELEIHQIELELQNEHLNATRGQLERALNQSSELYDFSPVGSVSLDAKGVIGKLNLAAANLLEGERARLLGSRFGLYVVSAELAAFNVLLDNARRTGDVQSGEIALTKSGLPEHYVQIRVSALPQDCGWQLVLVDVTERHQLVESLRLSEERWNLALDAAGDGVWDWNIQTGAVVFSRGYEQLYGFVENEYGGHMEDWSSRIHPDDRQRVMADVQAHLTGKTKNLVNEHRCQSKDGHWTWVLNRGAIVSRTPDGLPLRMVGTITDITRIKQTEEALQVAARFQQAVFDSLAAHIMVLDRSGKIIQANMAWRQYVQSSACALCDDLEGVNYLEVLACLTGENQEVVVAVAAGIASVVSGEVPSFQLKYPFFSPLDQHWFSMKVTAVSDADERVVISHEDVTILKAAELASLRLANTDALTGALSRRNFLNLAEIELTRATRYGLPLMLLMLDLDHFKFINDQYGHAVGDAVLQAFVKTVIGVLRESDLIGRLGGEEFAVLLPNTTMDGGSALAQRIIDSVRACPVEVAGDQVSYTVSIGVARLSQETSFATLLGLADTALYRAKKQGRDRMELAVS